MAKVKSQIIQAAEVESEVYIQGESGTGKELLIIFTLIACRFEKLVCFKINSQNGIVKLIFFVILDS